VRLVVVSGASAATDSHAWIAVVGRSATERLYLGVVHQRDRKKGRQICCDRAQSVTLLWGVARPP